jgi:hypothetical protein
MDFSRGDDCSVFFGFGDMILLDNSSSTWTVRNSERKELCLEYSCSERQLPRVIETQVPSCQEESLSANNPRLTLSSVGQALDDRFTLFML